MRHHGGLQSEEATGAAWEAGKGALTGALRWGIYAAVLGGAGYALSPIYRGLTIQFKVFLQMSGTWLISPTPASRYHRDAADFLGMIMGSYLDADHRIRAYEAKMRMEKRLVRDRLTVEDYDNGS